MLARRASGLCLKPYAVLSTLGHGMTLTLTPAWIENGLSFEQRRSTYTTVLYRLQTTQRHGREGLLVPGAYPVQWPVLA